MVLQREVFLTLYVWLAYVENVKTIISDAIKLGVAMRVISTSVNHKFDFKYL